MLIAIKIKSKLRHMIAKCLTKKHAKQLRDILVNDWVLDSLVNLP